MQALLDFIKTTALGGLVVIVPPGISQWGVEAGKLVS